MPDLKQAEEQFQRAVQLLNHVEGQLNSADNKAQFILVATALIGAALAVASVPGAQGAVCSAPAWYPAVEQVLKVSVLLAASAAVFFSLWATWPRLGVRGQSLTLWHFGPISARTEEEFGREFAGQPVEEAAVQVAAQIHARSRIAVGKVRRVRASIAFLSAGLLLWLVGQLLQILL
jgi:hypothetical protein